MNQDEITLKKVSVHNLKNVDLSLKKKQLIVFTGVSGSGKSSLAFDTIYVEGQRRFLASLSHAARKGVGDLRKPEMKSASGISPTIAIEQKLSGRSPRSTVGTMTSIYDYLRVLFARIGQPHCPVSKEPISALSRERIFQMIKQIPEGTMVYILYPFAQKKRGSFREELKDLAQKGYLRVRLDGSFTDLNTPISLDAKKQHDIDVVVDRIKLQSSEFSRLKESVITALDQGKGLCSLYFPDSEEERLYSETAYAKTSGISYPALEPSDFSFNHPKGMCEDCQGLGTRLEFSLEKIIDPDRSIAEGCFLVGGSYDTIYYKNVYENLGKLYKFSTKTAWKTLSKEAKQILLYGTENKWTKMRFSHPKKSYRSTEFVHWQGVLFDAKQRFLKAQSGAYRKRMEKFMERSVCSSCEGDRLRPYPRACLLGGKNMGELTSMPLDKLSDFFLSLPLTKEERTIGGEILKELEKRLGFLLQVGLHYLCLNRTSPTLSGGEAQRVRLASQIGSGLVGATYVLDEPSIGLHPADHKKLIQSLQHLRDLGNTVLVVEHDPDTIAAADHVVDVGPFAGILGGEIVMQGSFSDLCNHPRSLTGSYLSGRKTLPFAKNARKLRPGLTIRGAKHHNLRAIDVSIPLGGLVCVTGVSGSGKSSLIADTLYPALANHFHKAQLPVGAHASLEGLDTIDKVIEIDQSPIGRTPRSNPATYIKLFDLIRDLYASLKESQIRGLKKGHFSFNMREGSCPSCLGSGHIKLDMDFMEDVWIPCSLCKKKRFEPIVLSVKYAGKNIHEVLEMSVSEAKEHFKNLANIAKKLDLLDKVGLGYMKLGQSSPTLSGGEAQRIKLTKELIRPDTGKTLYILDEPTTGLHLHDLSNLLYVLHTLVDKGNTVLVIEHNMDFIKTADWIIDLGPKAGINGGLLMGEGTVEQIKRLDTPTGRALSEGPPQHTSSFVPETKQLPIVIKGAEQNNLKSVDLTLTPGEIIAFSGPSGSGKTSLAFDTIYAEGQRRYVESLSTYAKSLVHPPQKPKVGTIDHLFPAIAIEQTKSAVNPRSTIGTLTEIYDLLRLLFSHMGIAHAPETGNKIETIHKEFVADTLIKQYPEAKIHVLSAKAMDRGETFPHFLERMQREGFIRIRLNGTYYEVDQEIPFSPNKKNNLFLVVDRLIIKEDQKKRLIEAIDQAASLSDNMLTVALEKKDLFFNLAFADPKTGKSYPKITPQTFSFNAQEGMCPDCQGIGSVYGCSILEEADIETLSIMDLLEEFIIHNYRILELLESYFLHIGINPYCRIARLTPSERQTFLQGSTKRYSEGDVSIYWKGLETMLAFAAKYATKPVKDKLVPFMHDLTCPACEGTRLNPLARNVQVEGKTLPEFCELPISDCVTFLQNMEKKVPPFLLETFEDIQKKFHFLEEIGLGYLSLNRTAPSLSGGELQRIRLARQLGSGLTSCLYVLDEPTIGLHPHNNHLLNQALKKLQSLGNTLIVVEHDPMTLKIADTIVDFGPGAGHLGGKITAKGTLEEIKKDPNSLTGAYLSGKKTIPIPKKRRPPKMAIEIRQARVHNLQNISLSLPKHTFTCITGVSGSGKTSLLHHVLKPALSRALKEKKDRIKTDDYEVEGLSQFDKLITIDQNVFKVSSKSDVASYSDALTPLRSFYASLKIARSKGLFPYHFSYHHKKGVCKTCYGLGYKTIDLQFLPSVRVPCDSCHGYKLNPKALEVLYKNQHLGHVLGMSVDQATDFFVDIPTIVKKLRILQEVGLGYLLLGQQITELSGGETARIRLAKELSKRATGKTLYLIDEPTTGLHPDDIQKLIPIFQKLVDKKNTLVVIEHTVDFINTADYIVDIGPGPGASGGSVVATGTPEEVSRIKQSVTGRYLC
ncbi:MAG: excinuclease ABC subunit UvrA [Chlamydiota bacterium]